MLKVFVCEDDVKQRENIVSIITKYLYMQDYDMSFAYDTGSPEELLTYITSGKKGMDTGLYFLDVDLNTKMNGISLGAEIRKLDSRAKIVFVTTHAELSYLTFSYKVEAMDYISKDNYDEMKKKIIECIDVAMERHLNITDEDAYMVVKDGDTNIKVPVAEVKYIESSSSPHKLVMHLDNRQIEFYGNIKDMAELNTDFYRCHQSYVVNVRNIEQVIPKTREIVMKDGEVCYASVRYLKGLMNKLKGI